MWKAIPNYEGYYEVNELGEVRSLDRTIVDSVGVRRTIRGGVKKLSELKNNSRPDSQGYLVANLRKDGMGQVVYIHTLVAKAFIPNPECLPVVNHIDGNKHNNRVDNLEWASYSENNTHALRCHLRKPRGQIIAQYDLCGELISTYQSVSEAARETNLGRSSISHCVHGYQPHHGGYIWRKFI